MVLITYTDESHFERNSTGPAGAIGKHAAKNKWEIDVRIRHEIGTAILTDRGAWKHSFSKWKNRV